MSFKNLISHVQDCDLGNPGLVVIDRDIVPYLLENTVQDEIYFVPADLDTRKSMGHSKQLYGVAPVYSNAPCVFEV